MGGRYRRLSAEARLKRAAVYVVQTGNGATPTRRLLGRELPLLTAGDRGSIPLVGV